MTMPREIALQPTNSGSERAALCRHAIGEQFDVLGIKVDSLTLASAVERLEAWIEERKRTRCVSFANVHAVMEARRDETFKRALRQADIVCPDGMPLVWIDRFRGGSTERVTGPEFMFEFFRRTEGRGYSHFLYGAAPAVVEQLAATLQRRFPMARIAGFYSPPYRPLSAEEDRAVVEMINSASPDVLWVGLGCPKQELWMAAHRDSVRAGVMLGVGQAFDIHASAQSPAPRWMSDHGLEWFWRLCREPRRLWKRYLLTNTGFLLALAANMLLPAPRQRLEP